MGGGADVFRTVMIVGLEKHLFIFFEPHFGQR
jgi:hypothetical protein